jgi:hypothetical protein
MLYMTFLHEEMGTRASKVAKATKKHLKAKAAPPEGDPLRKFYVSLFRQKPSSKMAIEWLCVNGLGHIVIDIKNLQIAK